MNGIAAAFGDTGGLVDLLGVFTTGDEEFEFILILIIQIADFPVNCNRTARWITCCIKTAELDRCRLRAHDNIRSGRGIAFGTVGRFSVKVYGCAQFNTVCRSISCGCVLEIFTGDNNGGCRPIYRPFFMYARISLIEHFNRNRIPYSGDGREIGNERNRYILVDASGKGIQVMGNIDARLGTVRNCNFHRINSRPVFLTGTAVGCIQRYSNSAHGNRNQQTAGICSRHTASDVCIGLILNSQD